MKKIAVFSATVVFFSFLVLGNNVVTAGPDSVYDHSGRHHYGQRWPPAGLGLRPVGL